VRAVLQRVTEARVTVEGEVVGEIGPGIVVLLGVARDDTERDADYLAEKVANLRVFEGPGGKLDRPIADVAGSGILVVPNFTICADARRGRRPDLASAARPEKAESLCDRFASRAAAMGVRVATGRFGAHMHVELTNDGPVTLVVESPGR